MVQRNERRIPHVHSDTDALTHGNRIFLGVRPRREEEERKGEKKGFRCDGIHFAE